MTSYCADPERTVADVAVAARPEGSEAVPDSDADPDPNAGSDDVGSEHGARGTAEAGTIHERSADSGTTPVDTDIDFDAVDRGSVADGSAGSSDEPNTDEPNVDEPTTDGTTDGTSAIGNGPGS